MNALLDTNFLLWIVAGAPQLERYPWLNRYAPWWISPVTFLEMEYLSEVGRLSVDLRFGDVVSNDPRFVVDDIGTAALIRAALPLSWTRDPFDRLLCAHSNARRVPLCTTDRDIARNHKLLVEDLD